MSLLSTNNLITDDILFENGFRKNAYIYCDIKHNMVYTPNHFYKDVKINVNNGTTTTLKSLATGKYDAEGYEIYKCFLNDPEFKNTGFGIYDHKCKYYKPCRSYRKWLKENLKDEK